MGTLGANRDDSQAAVVNVSNGFAQRGVPLSMVVVDWQSWSPAPRGDENFGDGWPDPKRMVQRLAARNTQLMVSPYHNMVDCKRATLSRLVTLSVSLTQTASLL